MILSDNVMAEENRLLLERIARFLMLKSSFVDMPGLLNGKMGIAVFFFHYAKYTGMSFYNDFGCELIEDIYEHIDSVQSNYFADGIIGIGWGIEYLIHNGFMEGDEDDVLEDIDQRVVEINVKRLQDDSLFTGLEGIAHYVLSRFCTKKELSGIIDKEYVNDLLNALMSSTVNNNNHLLRVKLSKIINENLPLKFNIDFFIALIKNISFSLDDVFKVKRDTGIMNNGFAGVALKILLDNE